MTIATQLSIYNGACSIIGERQLQTLSENRESRRALDDIWNRGGVRTCLSMGLWNFAARGAQLDYDANQTPAWGYQCVFEIPADWVRWMAVCTDPYLDQPLLQCTTEASYFYCDLQRLWVKYVSDDARFGMNMAAWPDNFQRYVEAYFASEVAIRLTGDKSKKDAADKEREDRLKRAKSTDAMNESTTMLPVGQWRQARHGRRANIERGNPYSLYG